MLDGQPLRVAVFFEDVDRAPVGERGHRETGHAGEGLVVVEGGGEHGARLAEKALRLLSTLAFGYVPEVHGQPFPGRVGPPRHPRATAGEHRLELGGDALLHGALYLPVGLGVHRLGKFLPDVLAEQFLPGAAPELLRLAVDIGEAPLLIYSVEGVADAFEYVRGPFPGRLLAEQKAFPLFGLLALRYVPRYLREAAKVSLLVPERGDHHVRPESRAVIADPQSYFLVLSTCGREAQHLFRVPASFVLPGVENREVLADNLRRLVPLDAPGPRVPRRNVPAGIQHENGVVLDPLHQKPEALLALPQDLPG